MVWLINQKEGGLKSLRSAITKEKLQLTPQKYKASKDYYKQIYVNEIHNPEEWIIPRNIQPPKTEAEEIENMKDQLLVIKLNQYFFS